MSYQGIQSDAKHTFDAAFAPGATNDASEGYKVGSFWFDTSADVGYACLDATPAAAVWKQISGNPGGAPDTAKYLTDGAEGGLSAEVNIQALLASVRFIAAADVVPLIAKGDTGQTAPLFQVVDDADTVKVQVLAGGKLDLDFGAAIDGDLDFDSSVPQQITKTGAGGLVIGCAVGGGDLDLKTEETVRWRVVSTGELQAQGANGAIQNVLDPVNAQDAATKAYVDALVEGLDPKGSVVTRATGNVDLSLASDPNPINGVTVTDGERVALFEQSTGPQDGIYVAVSAIDPTTWTRAVDFAVGSSVRGAHFWVEEGGDADRAFIVTNDAGADIVGTDPLTLVQYSALGQIVAGDGLMKTGDTLEVELDGATLKKAVSGLKVSSSGIGPTEIDQLATYDYSSGVLRAADPVGVTDVATKSYVDANQSKVGPQTIQLDVAPNGNGAAATASVFNGIVSGQEFSIGDEMYFRAKLPANIDMAQDAMVNLRLWPQGTEASKNISFDLAVLSVTDGIDVSTTTGTVQLVDQAIPATVNIDFGLMFVLPFATYLGAGVLELLLRLTRVAATADPVSHPVLHSAELAYETV